jgi:diadenosine tetraphosphate (Ap4A) HIT family hydrolase
MNDQEKQCPFCAPSVTALAANTHALAISDKYPVSLGHCLVIPKVHVADIFQLPEDVYLACLGLVRVIKALLDTQYHPAGFNIGINSGKVAGQTIFHAHIHVIPRYMGDVPDPTGGVRNIIPGKGTY